jgi:ParB-like chromosome segregation protein Spo0J
VKPKPFRESPAEGRKTEGLTHIGDLVPDAQNRRRHTAKNIAMVVEALHQVGAARSIVIDEDGVILAGNASVSAAVQSGITKVQVLDTDGDTLVAVRRRGLSPEQKRALALYDNRSAELADWDIAQLAADVAEGFDLSAFFEADELLDLLGDDAPVPDFAAADQSEQGRLDQLEPVTCPNCGHAFHR